MLDVLDMKLGDPVTISVGTDRYVYRIKWMSHTRHIITVHTDKLGTETLTRRRNGEYKQKGQNYGRCQIGVSDPYLSPEF